MRHTRTLGSASPARGLLTAAALAAIAAGCTTPPPAAAPAQQPIIGGDPVGEDGFPTVGMMVDIGTASRDGMPAKRGPLALCTGTLISPTAVLLAAHCVDPDLMKQSLQQAGITLEGEIEHRFTFENSIDEFIEVQPDGSKKFDDKPTLLAVSSFDQMPINALGALQRPGQMDDIAVLHLASPVKGRPVQALATPDIGDQLQTGTMHAVAGYGQTSNDPGDFNGDGVEDPAEASAGTLHSGVSKLDTIGQYEIIAGDMDPQQACRGDSGGPIFADDTDKVQIGIASRINALPIGQTTPPRCEPGLLYTRVDMYLDWVKSKVPDVGQATQPCMAGDPDPSCPGHVEGGGDGGVGNGGGNGGIDGGGTGGPGGDNGGTGGNGNNPGGGGGSHSGCSFAVGANGAPGAPWLLLFAALLLGATRRRHA